MRHPTPISIGSASAAAFVIALAALLTGCSQANPAFCCVTADTCSAAGITGETRPCGVGQACRAYECVAAECTTSADCRSPAAPMCLHQLCVAGCTIDDDCAGLPDRARCDTTDATCVGCTSNDQCSAAAPICDSDARACRGCTSDDQCASGVCIEADGTCAPDAAIVYVAENGIDEGTCPRAAPCETLAYAMGLTSATRNVVRVLASSLHVGNAPVWIAGAVVIDGSNTTLTSTVFPVITASGHGTIEGIRLSATDRSRPLIRVTAGGALTLTQVRSEFGLIEVRAGGVLDARRVEIRESDLECKQGGSLTLHRSRLDQTSLDSSCDLVLTANTLIPPPGALPSLQFGGERQRVENNVFIGANSSSILIAMFGSAESVFRFNTVVSMSPTTSTWPAIACIGGVDMTSNIIAYNSTNPIECEMRNSLFDAVGVEGVNRGTGNVSADAATFFVERQAGDFRLSSNSPALGLGELGLVSDDLDGSARPLPAGSRPDVGAFEAP